MPRFYQPTATQARHAHIAHEVLHGDKPIKAIAVEVGLTEMSCRKVLWALGFRAMHLAPDERDLIRARRRSSSLIDHVAA